MVSSRCRNTLFFLVLSAFCGYGHVSAATITVDFTDNRFLTRLYPLYPPNSYRTFLALPPPRTANQNYALTSIYGGSDFGNSDLAIVRITGQLSLGDTDKIAQLWSINIEKNYDTIFSLNSPGGSYGEGIRLGNFFSNTLSGQEIYTKGVIIEKNSICLSACAIAFSLAVSDTRGLDDTRYVESGGVIGFHSPYALESDSKKTLTLKQSLDLSYEIASSFISLIGRNKNPPRLIEKILSHRRQDDFLILKDSADLWNYGFTPVAESNEVKVASISNIDEFHSKLICDFYLNYSNAFQIYDNYIYGSFTSPGLGGEPVKFLQDDTTITGFRNIGIEELINDYNTSGAVTFNGTFYCQLQFDSSKNMSIAIWRTPLNSGPAGTDLGAQKSLEPCGKRNPQDQNEFCVAPSVVSTPVSNRMLAQAFGCDDSKFLTETFNEFSPAMADFNTSIRERPSIESNRREYLKPGDAVNIVGCELSNDNEGVWYEIESDGIQGFTSARFIKGQQHRKAPQFEHEERQLEQLQHDTN
ncbi:hypothetical protein [Jiella avicenniae]|uniref:SH3 domain-containing protein n=1 Tax=Jiella avicenniae TaxID=2907202 RepID=A0A9X1T568_9HYPH|nr:hypothetical protein [Jiella avicenniae]MCE7028554.1 hypothetical protein [Jiella avicenniae]